MSSVKKLIILVAISFVLSICLMPHTLADTTEIVTDGVDDVIVMSYTDDSEEQSVTDTKPNLDITKLTYVKSDQTSKITLKIEVNGVIEDKNDFADIDNLTDYSGAVITYLVLLQTSNNSYEFTYSDEILDGGDDATFSVSGSELSITFSLIENDETFVSLYGYSMEMDFTNILNAMIYMDIAPDEALFLADASGPSTGDVGEEVSFSGEVIDFFSLGTGTGTYTYLWDFGDGSADSTAQNPTHVFNYPGEYTVELTVESSTGDTTSATTSITISEKSNTNGGDTNPGENGDEDSGNGFILFIGVVLVIIVIGVIALVVVIRR